MPSRTIYSDMQPNVLKLLQCCTFTKNNNNLLLLLNESNRECMRERERERKKREHFVSKMRPSGNSKFSTTMQTMTWTAKWNEIPDYCTTRTDVTFLIKEIESVCRGRSFPRQILIWQCTIQGLIGPRWRLSPLL